MKKCEKCGTAHDGHFGSGRFCSRSCANSNIHTAETRLAISEKLLGKKSPKRNVEDWKNSLSLAHKKRQKIRESEVLALPYESLRETEKRTRILNEQHGKCLLCGISQTWNDIPLKFERDHIDGNHQNNFRENLRMICPNCHSQTPTFRRVNTDRKVTDQEFIGALLTSDSIYKAIEKLKIRPNGGGYRRARRLIKEHSIKMEVDK